MPGLLPRQGLAFLVGAPSAGKSFFAIELSLCIASGGVAFGRPIERLGAVYVASEAPNGVRKRMLAWRQELGLNAMLELIPEAVNLTDQTSVDDLAQTLREVTADFERQGGELGVVVIDTVAASSPGARENESSDMSAVIGRVQKIANEIGVLVILVAHWGKDEARGIRGWSGQAAAADAIISVERIKSNPGQRVATFVKVKEGEDGQKFGFRLKPVEGWSGGASFTSAIIKWEPLVDHAARALSQAEHIVWEAVRGLPSAEEPSATDAFTVSKASLKKLAIEGGLAKRGEASNTVTQRFGRALDSLKDLGYLTIDGDQISARVTK